MAALPRIALVAGLLAVSAMMGGCSSGFDVDKLDIFNLSSKTKLPGDRKPLFPEGVPGVSQGIPPDLVMGNRPAQSADSLNPPAQGAAQQTAAAPAAEPVKEEPKPRPKAKARPKPKVVRAPPGEPTQVTVQPAQQQQQPAAQASGSAPSPWPTTPPKQQASGANAPWPATPSTAPAPWPSAPAPGTFSR